MDEEGEREYRPLTASEVAVYTDDKSLNVKQAVLERQQLYLFAQIILFSLFSAACCCFAISVTATEVGDYAGGADD
jgi:uncharacterized membrane protein YhfC